MERGASGDDRRADGLDVLAVEKRSRRYGNRLVPT